MTSLNNTWSRAQFNFHQLDSWSAPFDPSTLSSVADFIHLI